MKRYKKIFEILFFAFYLLAPFTITCFEKPCYVENQVWQRLEPYLLPQNHPIKPLLDEIFKQSRATYNSESLLDAGFTDLKPRQWTHLVVTKHCDLAGYIFKIYLDAENCFNVKKEYDYWLMRIEGVKLISAEIERLKLNHRFKTPEKWIYALPETPSPPYDVVRKNFILVEEDMNICDEKQNEEKWQSNCVNEDLLHDLYRICEKLGLSDCAKPDNIPFCQDGKIAFIDTQTHHHWPVRYYRLTPCLSQEMQKYWKKLTE